MKQKKNITKNTVNGDDVDDGKCTFAKTESEDFKRNWCLPIYQMLFVVLAIYHGCSKSVV